jgi:hypothetical protein
MNNDRSPMIFMRAESPDTSTSKDEVDVSLTPKEHRKLTQVKIEIKHQIIDEAVSELFQSLSEYSRYGPSMALEDNTVAPKVYKSREAVDRCSGSACSRLEILFP